MFRGLAWVLYYKNLKIIKLLIKVFQLKDKNGLKLEIKICFKLLLSPPFISIEKKNSKAIFVLGINIFVFIFIVL